MKDKIFRFKISLDKDIYRVVDVKGSVSLYRLAETITESFKFDFDHCFGFFSKTKDSIFDSEEGYELFNDMEDCEPTPCGNGVKKHYVYKVFHEGKKMTFYFDYGDDWHFLVECLEVMEPKSNKRYPQTIESKGYVEQYPNFEEDDEDFDEDEFDDDAAVAINQN